ncbi:DUF6197 family protein [Streptomyces asiaticus]|uniref:DUF6197 family protein n=1 Tax=Streptomyces asiaticus TaxID=114695 RepID=UPI0037FADCC6
MPQNSTEQRPRTAPPSAVPLRVPPTRRLVDEALRDLPAPIDPPPWTHRLLPAALRGLMADLGLWENPQPQKPSRHLEQTLAVLRRYGWCQTNGTITGRVCIRTAQNVLQRAGHVTPAVRERAVAYMQAALTEAGIHMTFFTWNDLPEQTWSAVEKLLVRATNLARQNGE